MVTRRVVLQLAGSLGLTLGLPAAAHAADAPAHWMAPDLRATLVSYFDTLIPDGGVGAEIDQRLIALPAGAEREILADACNWLDSEARRDGALAFAALAENGRNIVLERAFALPVDQSLRRFFDRTRALAFSNHYSKATSWADVGYAGPPQPRGFMDYSQAPSPSPPPKSSSPQMSSPTSSLPKSSS
jgi:hypothetical protein